NELGRRVARNTQIIAMEESGLGRVADPAGGAWFSEGLANDLAEAAWEAFQRIETEGGYGASLMADAVQARTAETRTARMKHIAKRKDAITGVSEFPQLDEIAAPVAEITWNAPKEGVSDEGLKSLLPKLGDASGDDAMAAPLWPIRLSEPYEGLRDIAEARAAKTGQR
ncbi:MAG: methylmalonyl-CoA mutase family protein, partial [Pseudomonadota bacterium]